MRDPVVGYGAAVLLILLMMLTSSALCRRLDHDEHQFVATGALLARRGLLPYLDYPYFHVPYLVFANAAVFKITGHLLLGARVMSALFSFGIVLVVFFTTAHLFSALGRGRRIAVAAAVSLLLIASPVYSFTSGRAWNHDVPTFLLLAAFLCAMRGIRGERALLMFAAGVLVGIATGTRLTFIVAAGVLAVSPYLAASLTWRRRHRLAAGFAAGLVLALAPLVLLAMAAPRQFIFGNFRYPMLNTAFRQTSGYTKSMTPLHKLRYLAMDIVLQPMALPGVIVLGVAVFLGWRRWRSGNNSHRLETQVLALLCLGMLAAGMAPTPLFVPYFFTPLVLLALLGVHGAAAAWGDERSRNILKPVLLIALALIALPAAYDYRTVLTVWNPRNWTPMRVHEDGVELARACQTTPHRAGSLSQPARAGEVRVVTVMPIIPLEGGLNVFEQLATGPFSVRIGSAVAEKDKAELKLLDFDDVAEAFWACPEAVVLSGGKDAWEDQQLLEAIDTGRLERHVLASGLQWWSRRAAPDERSSDAARTEADTANNARGQ
jgi:hypothetical protein